MKKEIEQEYKFQINKEKYFDVLEFLKTNNFYYDGYCFERTIRLDTISEDYSKQGIFFRAKSGFNNTFGFKSKNISKNECNQYNECEIEISSQERLITILKELNIFPIRTLEKYRMRWIKNSIIVTIDELPYGLFVEIEGELSQITIIAELMGFKKEQSIRKTYWELSGNTGSVVFPDGYSKGVV